MARWQDVADSAPEFARRAQALFDAHKHKTLATLRKNGAPRISGIEADFRDGEVILGMMRDSQKLADVLRDPRIALHSTSEDPPPDPERGDEWAGDAKLSGRVVPMTGASQAQIPAEGPEGEFFTVDIQEVVLTHVGTPADHLVIELWRPGKPLKTTTRA
jgi:pyridoxamine 5'-phosphate oxidase-like protein